MDLKKSCLIVAFFTILTIGGAYGLSPAWFAQTFLAQPEVSVDQAHIFRAVMTLYFALGGLWLYCAFKPELQNSGLVVLALFCGGLVVGRVVSVVIDGLPSPILLLYIGMEFGLIPVCLWLIKQPSKNKD